jgi:hypothetical protein
MEIIVILIGMFFMGIGYLVRYSPDLIAGSGNLSKNKKEKLSRYLQKGLFRIGQLLIIGFYVFHWLGFTFIARSAIWIIPAIGILLLVLFAQKTDAEDQYE